MGYNENSAKRKAHSTEWFQKETNNLTEHLKALKWKEVDTPKRSGHQEINKLRTENNQLEIKWTIQTSNEIKSWFFEKSNNIDNINNSPLARLTRGWKESIQINKIRNNTGDIITETEENQEIIISSYNNLYSNKLKNLDAMDNFLKKYQLSNLNQDQVNHLNSPITPKEIEVVIKSLWILSDHQRRPKTKALQSSLQYRNWRNTTQFIL